MIPLAPCERCGAQSAGYADIDFTCNRRRCPIRGFLNAKDEMIKEAYAGPEPIAAKRKAAIALLDIMLWSSEHEDEVAGMSHEEMAEWVKTHGPQPK